MKALSYDVKDKRRRFQQMSKKSLLIGLASIAMLMTGCSGSNTQAAAMTASYLSPSVMKYSNMRPKYNYYTLEFSMERLQTFSDGTYQLDVISQVYSALILPEEGSAATGNERTNYVNSYYGTFTSTVDDLDSNTLHLELAAPTRIVSTYDAAYYYDTANWTDAMSAIEYTDIAGNKTTYTSGDEYLSKNKFESASFVASIDTSSIQYVTLEFVKAE